MKKIILVILGLYWIIAIGAQNNKFNPLASIDYSTLEIPSLDILFENAKSSPAVEYYQVRMEEEASLLKTEKRSWLKYFKIGGLWQYGRVGINSSFSDEYTPLFYQYSGATQNLYNVSASISIPLDDIFDRGNRIKRQKLKTRLSQVEIEKWHDEQKIRIIEAYTQVIKELSVLKLKLESLSFANGQFEVISNDFRNGNVGIGELNTVKLMQANALESYEETRGLLARSILQLEVLSKTKIINK